jgi:hypothetical protein
MRQREIRAVALRREAGCTPRRRRERRSWAFRCAGAAACALAIALGVGASPVLAGTATSSVSPALRAQARELYAAVRRYERSTTPTERARSRAAARHVGKVIDACQAPYLKKLTQGVYDNNRFKLYSLYEKGILLETYQADVKPVAAQLATLAASWARLSLRNRALNAFAHALAAEFHATLDAAPFDGCGFVTGIAAHHFSYAWAKRSSYGLQAKHWWTEISRAGDRVGPFWNYVNPATLGGLGLPLFTNKQLAVLANLPGELS